MERLSSSTFATTIVKSARPQPFHRRHSARRCDYRLELASVFRQGSAPFAPGVNMSQAGSSRRCERPRIAYVRVSGRDRVTVGTSSVALVGGTLVKPEACSVARALRS